MVNKTNIATNSVFLYFRMAVTMLISLYATRIILQFLGVVNFGVYGVIWSFVSIFSFFNLSMATASRRCLSFELGRNSDNNFSLVLSALVKYSIIAGVFIYALQELCGIYLLDSILNIPLERKREAMLSFHILCAVFLFTVIQIPFISSLISQEKIKIYSYISIFDSILKLVLVFSLSFIPHDMLVSYCMLLLFQQIIVFCIYIYFGIKNIKFNFKRNHEINKEINKYLIWNTLGGLSSVGLNQGIQLLINMFFTPIVNAAQIIAAQVRNAAETFTSNIRISFNPPLIKSCAQGNTKEIVNLLSFSTRFSSIAVLLITVPLISKLDYILELWLVSPPEYTSILCLLFLINSIIDNASTPIVSIIQAKGNIKRYQIITSILLLSILPLSYFSYSNDSSPEIYGYYYIICSLLILCVRISFLKKIMDEDLGQVIRLIFNQIIIVPVLAIIIPFYLGHFLEDTLINLIIIVVLSVLIVFILSWVMILKVNERKLILDILKSKYN